MFQLGEKSLERLGTVKPSLQAVVKRAIELSTVDFRVIEGIRTLERQKYLLKKGATRTLKSKHLTGDAVDLAPVINGQVSWDWQYFHPIAQAMKQAAEELETPIIWGGTWLPLSVVSATNGKFPLSKTFADGPHFQLS
jgi:peptidoglycan L-alanyl-D-glutamate endopeptidase CwlK